MGSEVAQLPAEEVDRPGDGKVTSWEEFFAPGLQKIRDNFFGVSYDPPTPTEEDPLGVFNTGLSVGPTGDTANLDPPSLHVGSFKTDEGRDAFGFDASVGVFNAETESDGTSLHHLLYMMGCQSLTCQSGIPDWMSKFRLGGEAEALTLGATAMDDGVTTEVGAAATAGGGALSLGNSENSLRGGLSEGPSVAGRVHRGDADGDGNRELGVGFDAGIFTFDIQSERLDWDWSDPFSVDWIGNDEDFWNGDQR